MRRTSLVDDTELEITLNFLQGWQQDAENESSSRSGLFIRFVAVLFSAVSAVLLSYRANVDGKLSFYGVVLKIISFTIMAAVFLLDERFDRRERLLYSVPKLFGIVMGTVQLVGIVLQDTTDNILLSI